MTDRLMVDRLAERVLGWRPAPDRYVKPGRSWIPRSRFGFVHHQQIIWDKQRTVLTRTRYWFQHEPCWFVRMKNAPWYGKAGENSTIWSCPSPKSIFSDSEKEEKFDHPTQKPMEVMRRPIQNHTLPGESLYDCFLGSGTTLIAAEQTGRVCFGVELDPKYVDVICRRWQMYTGKQAVLDGDGRTFDEIAKGTDWSSSVRQKLCRRLEELEKITAAAAQRIDNRESADAAREKILTLLRANNFQQGPKESLAETFARFLGISSQELQDRLTQRAYGHQSVYLGGL